MNIIICLDKNNGISFNNRRQSRDRNVILDMLLSYDNVCYLPNSALLFEDFNGATKIEKLEDAPKNAYVFVELNTLEGIEIDNLIVYRWDKIYPSDKKFTLLPTLKLREITPLKGNSHEIIFKETYLK